MSNPTGQREEGKVTEIERTCFYCGSPAMKCRCSYRHRRKGSGTAMSMENVSKETTIGEMKEEFESMMKHFDPSTHACWQFRFTKMKPEPKK